jgi:hypothetical protein
MPDDHHPLMPRRNPEDVDLGAIKPDLEFLIERVERLRSEQALRFALRDARLCRHRYRVDRFSDASAYRPSGSPPGTSSSRSSRPCWSVTLRRWQRVTHRLRSDQGTDRLQGLDALQHEVPIGIDDVV